MQYLQNNMVKAILANKCVYKGVIFVKGHWKLLSGEFCTRIFLERIVTGRIIQVHFGRNNSLEENLQGVFVHQKL